MYIIYYYSMGDYHPTKNVFEHKQQARKKTEWLNENVILGLGKYVFKRED